MDCTVVIDKKDLSEFDLRRIEDFKDSAKAVKLNFFEITQDDSEAAGDIRSKVLDKLFTSSEANFNSVSSYISDWILAKLDYQKNTTSDDPFEYKARHRIKERTRFISGRGNGAVVREALGLIAGAEKYLDSSVGKNDSLEDLRLQNVIGIKHVMDGMSSQAAVVAGTTETEANLVEMDKYRAQEEAGGLSVYAEDLYESIGKEYMNSVGIKPSGNTSSTIEQIAMGKTIVKNLENQGVVHLGTGMVPVHNK